MKRTTQGILIGSGIALAGFAVAGTVSYFTTRLFINTALDRQLPKRMKNKSISKAEKDKALISQLNELSEKLRTGNCETIKITTGHDNETLIGHWHHKETDKRIIIAMHGWRSSWTRDFGAISDFWHNNGCSVLYAEQRGQNNSGGDYMGFGMIERYDCLDWIEWVNEHNEKNLPIYLAGISMGASTVLMAGGFELPENVHGIMADCGFTSANAIWKHVAVNNMHLSYKIRSRMINDLCRKKILIGSEDYTTIDALKNNKIPVLFIHGTADDFVPIDMTYENYMACNAPKRLLVVPGAPHAMSYIIDKDKYELAVKNFWNDYDDKD